MLAAGTYYPDPTGLGDSRDAIFALVAEAEVYGGWAGTESYLDERDSFENETILSGDLNGDDLAGFGNRTDNSYQVVQSATNALLDGFTVKAGYNADMTGGAGAGVFVNTDMQIRNCRIEDNWANSYGGGVYIEDSAVTMGNCLIVGNRAHNGTNAYGGGIFAYYSAGNEAKEFVIGNCTVSDNISTNESFRLGDRYFP